MHRNEHEAFLASRCQDYVYVPNQASYYKQLDKHVESTDEAANLPLVVLGEPGVGKSALLANWVLRRKMHMHRDDFLFQHFVGSSRRSHRLADVLGRLETALKEHFHLREMEVPETEDRLRWGLLRYLEAASKKALGSQVMLIVIDSINALASEASSHGSLHWLPTELPANVRFILSASISGPIGARETVRVRTSINSTCTSNANHMCDNGASGDAKDSNEIGNNPSTFSQGSLILVHDDQRIYMELCRRKCHFLRIAPLTPEVREKIITEFLRHQESQREQQQGSESRIFVLEESQQARIVGAEETSCPLFLRMLLYALHVGATLPNHHCPPVDEQLNAYLGAGACPTRIVAQLLEAVKASIETSEDGSHRTKGLLGHVLAAVHASRNGLSDEELYGLVDLAMGTTGVACSSMKAIFVLLKGMTLVVDGLRYDRMSREEYLELLGKTRIHLSPFAYNNEHRSFSHEAFARVVFEKFVKTSEARIRQHELMARYFQRFPSCPRKLDCLAYHLEAAGLWHKLKEALVDVENFKLWWSPVHKKEFLSLWASLTNLKSTSSRPASALAGTTKEMRLPTSTRHQVPRAHFDVVDEYVRSIEEYREKHHPKDDDLGDVVLRIADFLLEFAILGHEELADVPAFLHPLVSNEDLKSVGVPFLTIDTGGEACLVEPLLYTMEGVEEEQDITSAQSPMDGTVKVADKGQAVSTYFYHRWMWIQFPLVAIANCGERYRLGSGGVAVVGQHCESGLISGGSGSIEEETAVTKQKQLTHGKTVGVRQEEKQIEMPASLIKIAMQPLQQPFIRKPTTAQARLTGQHVHKQVHQQQQSQHILQQQASRQPNRQEGKTLNEEVAGAMDRMASELRDDIRQYRKENDALVQQKLLYERAILDLANELTDLERIRLGSLTVRRDFELAQKKERKTAIICDETLNCNKNLAGVLLMCERHPPSRPALVQELEESIEQETQLIAQIKERVWEEAFERKAYTLDYPKLRSVIQQSLILEHELLTSHACLRENLTIAAETNLLMLTRGLARSPPPMSGLRGPDGKGVSYAMPRNDYERPLAEQSSASRWLHRASVILAKTGISEPDLFFNKLNNCCILEKQMTELKKTAELNLADIKDKQKKVERDLYGDETGCGTSRSDASITGNGGLGGTTNTEEHDNTLEIQMRAYKILQGKAAVAMLMEQRAREGLKHIAGLLGHHEHEGEDLPVNAMMRHIESTLVELTQRQQAQQHGQQGNSEIDAVSSHYAPSEKLEHALASFLQLQSQGISRRNSFETLKGLDQAAISFTTIPIPENI